MIIKSFEVQRQISNLIKNNLFLLYGENNGLKKDIGEIIKNYFEKENSNIELLSTYENEILEDIPLFNCHRCLKADDCVTENNICIDCGEYEYKYVVIDEMGTEAWESTEK